jgi:hypothetical protein
MVFMYKTYLGTGHDGWQVVVCSEWVFMRFSNDREWRCHSFETANRELGRAGDTGNISIEPTSKRERPRERGIDLSSEEEKTYKER